MFSQCIYWKGKGTVQVTSEGSALCYSGPRRVTLPPGLYTLSSMQKYIQQVLQEHTHVTSAAEETSSRAVFCFFPANDEKLKTDTLPPGWISRVHDPSAGVCHILLVSSSTSLHYSHRISGRNDYPGLTGGMCVCFCLSMAVPQIDDPRPPREGSEAGRVYYIYIPTQHAQWGRPFHRILLEITRSGYQANMAASSLRGLLGFDALYCPPILTVFSVPPAPTKSGVAKLNAAVTGGPGFFMAQSAPRITWDALKEVLTNVVTGLVRVDLEYAPEDDGAKESLKDEETAVLRVAKEESWQVMLDLLRSKATRFHDEPTEAEVDLIILKTAGK